MRSLRSQLSEEKERRNRKHNNCVSLRKLLRMGSIRLQSRFVLCIHCLDLQGGWERATMIVAMLVYQRQCIRLKTHTFSTMIEKMGEHFARQSQIDSQSHSIYPCIILRAALAGVCGPPIMSTGLSPNLLRRDCRTV